MSAGVFFSMRLRTLCSALPLVLAACGGESSLLPGGGGELSLRILGTVVAPAVGVEVIAVNDGVQGYEHGACAIGIEARVSGEWVPFWPEPGAGCIAIAYTLPAGDSYRQVVPAPSTEGTYRAVMRLSPAGSTSSVLIYSPTFQVLAAPSVEILATADSVDDGAELPLSLQNFSGTVWNYNICSAGRFQRRASNRWVEAPEPLRACTAELQTLGVLQTRTATASVPTGYVAGTYRFVLRLDAPGLALVAASDTFVVR